ncbi:MAG: hypothetical protein RR614_13340, partial [Eubacterium sp.]
MKNKWWIVVLIVILAGIILCFGWVLNKPYSSDEKVSTSVAKDTGQTVQKAELIQAVSTYDRPLVPEGFKAVDTEKAKWNPNETEAESDWNSGLVIEDEKGNQFVWVPINMKTVTYKDLHSPLGGEAKYEIDAREKEQIDKYGGFYMARYEAGVDEGMQSKLTEINEQTNSVEGAPVSKVDVRPWNYISFDHAADNSKKMLTGNKVHSDLMPESFWNMTFQWFNDTGYTVYLNSQPKLEDGNYNLGQYGNYSNVLPEFTGLYSEDYGKNYQYGENLEKTTMNLILSSGASERSNMNNIYDLCGNLSEYGYGHPRTEHPEAVDLNVFGGNYDNMAINDIDQGVSDKMPNDKIGFRVVLY